MKQSFFAKGGSLFHPNRLYSLTPFSHFFYYLHVQPLVPITWVLCSLKTLSTQDNWSKKYEKKTKKQTKKKHWNGWKYKSCRVKTIKVRHPSRFISKGTLVPSTQTVKACSSSDDNTIHYLIRPPRSSAMFCYSANNNDGIHFMSVPMAKITKSHLCVQLIEAAKEKINQT